MFRSSSTHPTTTTSSPPHFTLNHSQPPGHVPLPSVEGCGHGQHRLNPPRKRGPSCSRPLPFSKGCGQLILARRRNEGWINMRGYQKSGKLIQCLPTTNHDESRGSFSSTHLSLMYTDDIKTPTQRPPPVLPPLRPFHGPPWMCESHDNSRMQRRHRKAHNDEGNSTRA